MGLLNIFYIFLVLAFLIVPVVLQYTLHLKITENHNYTFSIYGLYLIVFTIVQFTFAFLNKKKVKKEFVDNGNDKKCNILVVGYKEKKEYFKNCLKSIKDNYFNNNIINKIIVVIDGNENDDSYMIDIFNNVFGDNLNITLDEYDKNDFKQNYLDNYSEKKAICISQKHEGKRSALFTGFSISLLEKEMMNGNLEFIYCTDSDTTIKNESIENMIALLDNDNVGAVAGNLSIFNKYDSFISFLSNIRYWFAFNVERAYQSFTGEVLCISGPIGMYKLNVLQKVITEWKNQTFLGNKCSYGDDRHLTNKILELPKKVVFSNYANAETETPDTIYRFYKQQIRWNKSALREFFWSIYFLDKHTLFMTINVLYMFLYPYLVMGYMLYLLYKGTVFQLGFYLFLLVGLGLVKSIYGFIMSKNPETLLYFLYGFVYVTVVFPARLWAMVSLNDNSWGTSTRNLMNNNISLDILSILLWNSALVSGFIKNIYFSRNEQISQFYFLIGTSGFYVIFSAFVYFYIYYKKSITSTNTNINQL